MNSPRRDTPIRHASSGDEVFNAILDGAKVSPRDEARHATDVADARRLAHELALLRERPPSPDFSRRLLDQLDFEPAPLALPSRRWTRHLPVAIAAGVGIVLGGGVVSIMSRPSPALPNAASTSASLVPEPPSAAPAPPLAARPAAPPAPPRAGLSFGDADRYDPALAVSGTRTDSPAGDVQSSDAAPSLLTAAPRPASWVNDARPLAAGSTDSRAADGAPMPTVPGPPANPGAWIGWRLWMSRLNPVPPRPATGADTGSQNSVK